MPALLDWNPETAILEVDLSGQLDKADYEQFAPEIDRLIKQQGAVRVLVTLHNFKGWTFAGIWEDIKFDARHYNDIDRLAIVGEKKWHEGMALFCKPFTSAKVRYFEQFEYEDARAWLTKESYKPSST